MSDPARIFLALSPAPLVAEPGVELWREAGLSLALSHADPPAAGEGAELWAGAAIGAPSEPKAGTAGGLLCIFMNVTPEAEAEFNAWYDTEHLPRLAAVPGVLSAARYRSQAADLRPYLALYRLETPQTQASEAWKTAAGTPWTVRMRTKTRDFRRLLFTPA